MEKPGDPKLGRFAVAVQRYLFNPFFFLPPPFSSLRWFILRLENIIYAGAWITNVNKGGAREFRWFLRSEEEKGFAQRKLDTSENFKNWTELIVTNNLEDTFLWDGKGPTEPWRGLNKQHLWNRSRNRCSNYQPPGVHFENTWKECRTKKTDEEKEERKKKKCGRETGLRGGKGRKLANWLAVVIQFKMDDGRGKERGLGA